jgi:hypothetical protein
MNCVPGLLIKSGLFIALSFKGLPSPQTADLQGTGIP